MARVRVDLRISGQLSNEDAKRFESAIESLEANCRERGLEVRSTGCDVTLDAEPPAEPVAIADDPAPEPEPEPTS